MFCFYSSNPLAYMVLLFCGALAGCQIGSNADRFDESVEIISEPADARAFENLANMLAAEPPTADLAQIFGRHNNGQPIPLIPFTEWQVGDTDRFFYTEQVNDTVVEITAHVIYQSDALVMWLEEGGRVNEQALQEAAQVLENEILPTTRSLFGSEPSPGIDGDTAIHILHIADMGGSTIGYFSGKDEYAQIVAPFSNEREMFYINLDFVDIGDWDYFDVVAHEFQHMIHWNLDRNEQTWINEGLAELSTTVNGYGGSDFLPEFLKNTDTSLTAFDYEGGDYGAAWLFMSWMREKYGEAFVKALVAEPKNGMDGLNALLRDYGHEATAERIYADWTVALYALNHNIGTDERYDFAFPAPYFQNVPEIKPQTVRKGELVQTTVGQFGIDFWRIPADVPASSVSIVITPSQQVRLIEGDPFRGEWFWTTVPADFSDMHLTRKVDLSAVTQATLEYQTWFDIEVAYDYAYVSVSADGGSAWHTLPTTESVEADPQGKNLGNGMTGASGGSDTAVWMSHSADLTPWAGISDLLIRFEYITDDAVQKPGLALDDIAIPEIGWFDDVEAGEAGWETAGFVRHTNRLPQTFILQTILIEEGKINRVISNVADENGQYILNIPAGGDSSETILAISGSTPVTYHPAGYQLIMVDPHGRPRSISR